MFYTYRVQKSERLNDEIICSSSSSSSFSSSCSSIHQLFISPLFLFFLPHLFLLLFLLLFSSFPTSFSSTFSSYFSSIFLPIFLLFSSLFFFHFFFLFFYFPLRFLQNQFFLLLISLLFLFIRITFLDSCGDVVDQDDGDSSFVRYLIQRLCKLGENSTDVCKG